MEFELCCHSVIVITWFLTQCNDNKCYLLFFLSIMQMKIWKSKVFFYSDKWLQRIKNLSALHINSKRFWHKSKIHNFPNFKNVGPLINFVRFMWTNYLFLIIMGKTNVINIISTFSYIKTIFFFYTENNLMWSLWDW